MHSTLKKIHDHYPQHFNITSSGLEPVSNVVKFKKYNFPRYQQYTSSNHQLQNVSINPATSFGTNPYGNTLDYNIPKNIDILENLFGRFVLTESGGSASGTANPASFIIDKLELFIGSRLVQQKFDNQMHLENVLFNTQAFLETRMADMGFDATNNDFSSVAEIAASGSATYYVDIKTILSEQGICISCIDEDIRLRVTWCSSAAKMRFAGTGVLDFTSFDLIGVERKLDSVERDALRKSYKSGYDVRYLNTIVQTKNGTT